MAAWLRRRYPDQTRMLVLLIVFAVSGLVWAATALRDGNIGDWAASRLRSPMPRAMRRPTPMSWRCSSSRMARTSICGSMRTFAPIRRATRHRSSRAGGNQTITLPATATLNGSATDDGLPNPPGALTYAWTMVSGPGNRHVRQSRRGRDDRVVQRNGHLCAAADGQRQRAVDRRERHHHREPRGGGQSAAFGQRRHRTRRSRFRRPRRFRAVPPTTDCRTRRAR